MRVGEIIINETENELKVLISKDEFILLKEINSVNFMHLDINKNYYFDTKDHFLDSRKYTLRIRLKNEIYPTLTLKSKLASTNVSSLES